MKNKYNVVINNNMKIECDEGELSKVISSITNYMTIITIDVTLKTDNELKEEN